MAQGLLVDIRIPGGPGGVSRRRLVVVAGSVFGFGRRLGGPLVAFRAVWLLSTLAHVPVLPSARTGETGDNHGADGVVQP